MSTITEEQLDRIGRLADKADKYLAARRLPLSIQTHIDGLTSGMQEIKDEATALYKELGGTE